MRALKKIMAALALTAVLAGCSGGGVLSSLKGGSTSAQSISRPAVESAELQFAHPAAGDTIAVFDTSAGIFKAVLFPDEAPPRPPISSTITPVPSVRQRTPRANAPAFSTSWRRCRAQTQ